MKLKKKNRLLCESNLSQLFYSFIVSPCNPINSLQMTLQLDYFRHAEIVEGVFDEVIFVLPLDVFSFD